MFYIPLNNFIWYNDKVYILFENNSALYPRATNALPVNLFPGINSSLISYKYSDVLIQTYKLNKSFIDTFFIHGNTQYDYNLFDYILRVKKYINQYTTNTISNLMDELKLKYTITDQIINELLYLFNKKYQNVNLFTKSPYKFIDINCFFINANSK